MAFTIEQVSNDIISPDELLEWAMLHVDPADDFSVVAASERLCALKNNRRFIIDKLCEQMSQLAMGMSPRSLSVQGTVHASGYNEKGGYLVRSVIWTPPFTKDPRSRALQDKTLSFSLPHDHNFGLLTIGYLGPGYTTILHEYDREQCIGCPDESVDLRYLETTTLSEGKIIYFRPGKDVHTQLHPPEVSISLNLITQVPNIDTIPQYEFDVERARIKNLLYGNTLESMLLPFRMASALGGDDSMIDPLRTIARAHESAHMRTAAYGTLSEIRADEIDYHCKSGLTDRSPLVRAEVENIFNVLSASKGVATYG